MKDDKSTTSNFAKKDLELLTFYKKTIVDILKDEELSSLDPQQWKYSSVNNHASEYALVYNCLLDSENTVTVLYKIVDLDTKSNPKIQSSKVHSKAQISKIYNISYISCTSKDDPFINQICPSGSITSNNGEYRSNMLNWKKFKHYLDTNKKINAVYKYIVAHFRHIFIERRLELTIEYIYFDEKKITESFAKNVKRLADPLKFEMYCITWFTFYYEFTVGHVSNNINAEFKNIMLKYKSEDLEFFKDITRKFTTLEIETFNYICNNTLTRSKANLYEISKIGQKMALLSLNETKNFLNIEYNIWRELAINTMVSNLVVNNIANGFALSNNWILIKMDNVELFDNNAQYEKIHRSEIAMKILKLLNAAKRYATGYFVKSPKNKNNSKNQSNSTEFIKLSLNNMISGQNSYLNSELDILNNNIMENIKDTSDFIMSDVVISMFSEYLGKTFYDISRNKVKLHSATVQTAIFSSENHINFKKYMFELCYNLYCLNTKVHCIHGDVHLNNLILSPIIYTKNVKIDIENPKVMFVIGDTKYIFNNNLYNLCIIDFSNSIINPEYYELFQQSNTVSERVQIANSKDSLLSSQITLLTNYLYYIKPEYKQFKSIIETNMEFHFDEYFKILSILDLYNITSKILTFAKNSDELGKIGIKSIRLVENLNKSANAYFSIFEKLLNKKDYAAIQEMEWPLLSIIKENFVDDLFRSSLESEITDIYNYNNVAKKTLSSDLPINLLNNINKTDLDDYKSHSESEARRTSKMQNKFKDAE